MHDGTLAVGRCDGRTRGHAGMAGCQPKKPAGTDGSTTFLSLSRQTQGDIPPSRSKPGLLFDKAIGKSTGILGVQQ